MREVRHFPDVLPLRDPRGKVCGLFADHGAWFGVTWGERSSFDICTLWNQRYYPFDLGAPLAKSTVWADCISGELANGARFRMGFICSRALCVEYKHHEAPKPGMQLPLEIMAAGEQRWFIVLAPEGGSIGVPDCFDANRQRWNNYFARVFTRNRFIGWPEGEQLTARAVTTLLWNRRAPRGDLHHHGVIPSPFAYVGYWGWDSWKHAHALARLDPDLAKEQIRSQFQWQREDGMVPDTARIRKQQNNWKNTKPPMAAWALNALYQELSDPDCIAEFYDPMQRFLSWWACYRRSAPEDLLQAGGHDHETAMWDSGWDDCIRFTEARLRSVRSWRLLEVRAPDLNSLYYQEVSLMAKFAAFLGQDARQWEQAEAVFQDQIRKELWDAQQSFFVDRGTSLSKPYTSVLSLAGCLPVWVGLATPEQAEGVRQVLLKPESFQTPMPFPIVGADQPGFDPDGYWNGSVWLDHAVFAMESLGSAGEASARTLFEQVHREGALYECYSPQTGRPAVGQRPAVAQFSWSAAAILDYVQG